MKIIVSITSTSSSSKPLVDIVTLAVDEPAGITISVPLTVYSSELAVPDNVNGIVMSTPETGSAVAVNVTVDDEFSSIESEDNAKVTAAASSLSVMVTVSAELSVKVPLVGVPGVIIIVSSSSSLLSLIKLNVIVPVVALNGILITGDNW